MHEAQKKGINPKLSLFIGGILGVVSAGVWPYKESQTLPAAGLALGTADLCDCRETNGHLH